MAYSGNRSCFDADSHLMEAPEWLAGYADPAIRECLRSFAPQGGGASKAGQRILEMIESARARIGDPEATRKLETDVLSTGKGWLAHGAMDPHERSRTLDLLGFEQQLVFATFSIAQFATSNDPELLYGGTRAHNRAMTDFCRDDPRLLPVGFLPLADPARSAQELEEALRLGCDAVWIPSDAPGLTSPAHVDLEPIWARLAEAELPFMLHIGGAKLLPRRYHNNGRPLPSDWLGGGENLRAKDFPVVHHSPERFLTCLVLDGVFDRHPGLRCGVIEQGASWVPGFLRHLDYAFRSFGRHEPLLQGLSLRPSDFIRRQVRFTPFAFEDVGWLVEQAGDELFLFSSDYPHPEGSRDPIGRFEASLDAHQVSDARRERFYATNFRDLMGARAAAH